MTTLEACREYWQSRITPEEGRQIAATIERAKLGLNPRPVSHAEQAVLFACDHHFYRHSVYDYKKLLITAMQRALGRALPEDIVKEADRRGVLQGSIWRDGKEVPGYATTKAVLAQENRITGIAAEGRGIYPPLGDLRSIDPAVLVSLSADQQAMVRHIRRS
ncbi:MAG TPA: hypothetical protein VJ739_09690, partial [Gemmataceae bacterium]|nr:hypothetical protein [Gemmataceae bacterium]